MEKTHTDVGRACRRHADGPSRTLISFLINIITLLNKMREELLFRNKGTGTQDSCLDWVGGRGVRKSKIHTDLELTFWEELT